MAYKEINTEPKNKDKPIIEVDLDQEYPDDDRHNPLNQRDDEDQDEGNEDNEDQQGNEDGDNFEEIDQSKPPQKQEKPKKSPEQETHELKRRSRARERIQELNNKAKQAEERERAAIKRAEELEQRLLNTTKTSTTSLKSTLESQIATLNQQMRQAIQAGEADQVVELQNMLFDAKTELRDVMSSAKTIEQQEEIIKNRPKPKAEQSNNDSGQKTSIPEAAQDWIAEHPEFNNDELFYTASIVVNKQLLKEGFDPESEEFYEEITNRLTPRFPEVFGIQKKKVVKSSEQDEDSDDSSDEETQKPSNKPVKQPQIVSGASRASPQSSSKGNKVNLTQQDLDQADRWGMSVNQIARRKAHIEKNRPERNGGYVPILID